MPFTVMDLNQIPTTSQQYGLRTGTDGMWFLDLSALAKSFAPMIHTLFEMTMGASVVCHRGTCTGLRAGDGTFNKFNANLQF
jgi:hypothetical protein